MGNVLTKVEEPVYSEDYINNDGNSNCYDVNVGEYAIAHDDEELFASEVTDNAIVVSIGDGSRLLLNGINSSYDTFQFLCENNFLDNCSIYVFSPQGTFDSLGLLDLVNSAKMKTSVEELPAFDNTAKDQSIIITKNEIKIASGEGDVISYEIDKSFTSTRANDVKTL